MNYTFLENIAIIAFFVGATVFFIFGFPLRGIKENLISLKDIEKPYQYFRSLLANISVIVVGFVYGWLIGLMLSILGIGLLFFIIKGIICLIKNINLILR